jgi:hypothetical protein
MSQRKRDLSISMTAATLYMLVFMIPLLVILLIPFTALWGLERFYIDLSRFMEWGSLLPALVIGVPLHELIHGLAWVRFGKLSLREIKFGLKSLTPYTHCKVPLSAKAYRAGALMPALLLGVLPYVFGLIRGDGWFITFGLVYIFAAGGDLMVLWILRGIDGQALVEDHPSRAGCYVMEEDSGYA